jgi:hypothetical protein
MTSVSIGKQSISNERIFRLLANHYRHSWYGGSEVLSNTSTLQPDEFMGYIGTFYTVLNLLKLITTLYYNIQTGSLQKELYRF